MIKLINYIYPDKLFNEILFQFSIPCGIRSIEAGPPDGKELK